ncbi:MAG: NAD(P)H-dependent oxidoreductase subunit E [Anaerolineae bacterium]|nr:NAD(P)H-dependent oxidoreductase subunit E [Anaerolineae bacterium]
MNSSDQPSERVIAEILSTLPHERHDLLSALDRVNSQLGYLPRMAIESVAHHFRLPLSRVHGAASFYAMWRVGTPPGEAVCLCEDGPCHAAGAAGTRRALEKAGVEVKRTSCIGHCGHGPVAVTDGRLYRDVTPTRVQAILTGEEPTPLSPADEIIGIEVDDRAHALLRNVGQIDPLSLEDAQGVGAYQALRKALAEMTPEQVVEEIAASGLQGRGGAGFPTGLKMRFTAAGAKAQAKDGHVEAYVVCNADESEPGTFKDRILIEGDPHQLLEGIAIAGYAIGAHEGYIYIRGEYADQAALLKQAIHDAEAAGRLGQDIMDSGFDFHIHVHSGAGAYICGEETALLEGLEGKRGEPRVRPPYPTTCGLFGQATLINNVETLSNLAGIIAHGADWYHQMGTDKSPGTKLYPISGHVKRQGCLEAPLGAFTLAGLIEGPAGGMRGDAPFKACHLGGAAGAIVGPEFLDISLEFGACRTAGAMLGAGDVLVLDANTCIVDYVLSVANFFRAESCGKCTPCRVGTERYRQILTDLVSGRGTIGQLDELVYWGELMVDSSFCGLGQTAPTAVMSALELFRGEFEAHARGECPTGVCRI